MPRIMTATMRDSTPQIQNNASKSKENRIRLLKVFIEFWKYTGGNPKGPEEGPPGEGVPVAHQYTKAFEYLILG